jgi:5-methylcytosine-specific restriction enzyme A
MTRRLRPCLVCGRPSGAARCPGHALPKRGWAHERASKQVRSEEFTCWICGEPARPGDPLTGDHIVPRIAGGQDVRGNMHAAHRSCNSRRGAGGRVALEKNENTLRTPAAQRSKV